MTSEDLIETVDFCARWQRLDEDPVFRVAHDNLAFKRLCGISFLGAADYVNGNDARGGCFSNRGGHSMCVAVLADFVAEARGYDTDLARHLAIAGLFHDIGHAPLSHSAEPALKVRLGMGHHAAGLAILCGQTPLGQLLVGRLAKPLDLDFIISLIEGRAGARVGGDLFSSPINIDTIEGVLSMARDLDDVSAPTPLEVAHAAFVEQGPGRYPVLDAFWKLKGRCYAEVINAMPVLGADHIARRFFADESVALSREDVLTIDAAWRERFPALFFRLGRLGTDAGRVLDGETIPVCERRFRVDEAACGMDRYRQDSRMVERRVGPRTEASQSVASLRVAPAMAASIAEKSKP